MPLSRRRFLRAGAVLAAAALPLPAVSAPRFRNYPYALGVASGYPTPEGIVLWTRLAPEPLQGGGMENAALEVRWEVATDAAFRRIVRRGSETAEPRWAHSVHVDVAGLEPARVYYYRFHAGEAVSPVGRTRTAPRPDGDGGRVRFAFASCQQYEQGYYCAYRHMAGEELDLVLHVGDYIYESSWGRNHVRAHEAGEPYTLADYRNRYARYKSDLDLQAAHAAFPWMVTWDDHEVDNDYANDRSQDLDPPDAFLARRAAAYQAYYEHLPLPRRMRPQASGMRIYTHADYGPLARFYLLDDRQYRDHQVCPRPERGGGSNVVSAAACPELFDPSRSLLGWEQERWLREALGASRSRWNVIAQQTLMAQVDRMPGEGQSFWTDGWDGYPGSRERLLGFVAERGIPNTVVIGGDIHTAVVADLKRDFNDPRSPVIATEFVCTSITSQGISPKALENWRAENPHIRYANSTRRGYLTMALDAGGATVMLRTVNEKDPDSAVRTSGVWTVRDGRPGAQPGA